MDGALAIALATIEKAKPQFLNFIIDGDWKFIGYQSAQGLGVSIKHLRFLSNHSQKLVLHCNAKLQLGRTGGVQGNPAMKACRTVACLIYTLIFLGCYHTLIFLGCCLKFF